MKAVPIYLVIARGLLVAEHAITENVSPHGARLRSSRKWRPGERPRVAMESSEFRVEAKVVYCEPLPEGSFCIGLEIRPGVMDWGDEAYPKPHAAVAQKAWSRFFADVAELALCGSGSGSEA